MDRQQIMDAVKQEMPERRWNHTLGVMKSAIELANCFGANAQQAELAAIVHDVAKYWQTAKMEQVIREQNLNRSVLEYNKELWHAPVGAWYAKQYFAIENEDVLNAVNYHTSGRAAMSLLEKVVWVADYIEPGRQFPGVDYARQLAASNLDEALLFGLQRTISFLQANNSAVFPDTIAASHFLLEQGVIDRSIDFK